MQKKKFEKVRNKICKDLKGCQNIRGFQYVLAMITSTQLTDLGAFLDEEN
jgi:hypothetical protein